MVVLESCSWRCLCVLYFMHHCCCLELTVKWNFEFDVIYGLFVWSNINWWFGIVVRHDSCRLINILLRKLYKDNLIANLSYHEYIAVAAQDNLNVSWLNVALNLAVLCAQCGLQGCKNSACSVCWPEVIKGLPNQVREVFSVSLLCLGCMWWFVYFFLVVSTSANDCLERLVSIVCRVGR